MDELHVSYDTSSRYYLHLAGLKLRGWIAKLEIFVDCDMMMKVCIKLRM